MIPENQDALRALVAFMKEQKVERFRYGDIEVQFRSDAYSTLTSTYADYLDHKEMSEEERKRKEEELLFHSAG
jgi:hypothetical protein